MNIRKLFIPLAVAALALSAMPANAVIITNGPIKLGVDTFGQLNVLPGAGETGTVNVVDGVTGIAFFKDSGDEGAGFYDATSPGCLCEGFGLSANGISGSANNEDGVF